MARELGYTLEDFTAHETYYNLRLWDALYVIEQEERRAEDLKDEVLRDFESNKGRFC